MGLISSAIKRTLDIFASFFALVLFAPFFLPIMLILWLTGEGEVFYRQERIGKGGKPFGLMKFATMLKNSPNMGTGTVTVSNDPRVLPMGKFLRKTKINELPQLWNVFIGHMSLVGPRPLTKQTFGRYTPEVQEQVIKMVPGLTGVGSIVFRNEEGIMAASKKTPMECYAEDIAPYKGALEVWYLHNRSLWVDLKAIILTVIVVMFPKGVSVEKAFKGIPELPPALRPVPADSTAPSGSSGGNQ